MKEEILIRVSGVQKDSKGEENKIELVTEGIIYKKNNYLFIVYEESEISGMEGTTTTIKIEGENKIFLKRYGNNDSTMVFEMGKRYNSAYKTLYGNFEMELYTNKLEVDISNQLKQGKIEIHYELAISGLVESKNQLTICF
ncbi:DUF1934 domain-containing protein [Alkaliphilus peptidifermentans]|uniref:Uncharacterized beta-barrel protein YwiB, DUF1934 family n=1 Tax=Alkaliphilus peptidifermentans DSM 18978 TaxID=1120976 RepID=A0A1G5KIX0_9FIRM|nr:DUF1934 domain-containing protein [Alkaliphilus peptidifermentans]SCZ00008.1 Uncharacterized beta-barrel protein YwiB, DUF1934 family [Alkaliphilus peptidifermentans DSM 18978]